MKDDGVKGWKIVQVTMLVREDDAEYLHTAYRNFIEHDDLSLSALVQTRNLNQQDEYDFGEVMEDFNEAMAEDYLAGKALTKDEVNDKV